ncbi:hypothetical protein Dvar_49040 [Desulfosarcina variabilis str. Montpellier]|uniref:hypothetical protein n=1 Tax=Desulfosarcina variabilis TaxID=2300 RepID=UPI003AFA5F82
MELHKLPNQLVDSVYSPDLDDIAFEISEIGLDQFLDKDFIKELPVVGVIARIFKDSLDMRNRIFLAKVARFLFRLKDVTKEQNKAFEEKIRNDPNLKRKVGQTLVLILERLDNLEKPDMVGKCFACYLSNKITFSQFRRLSSAIDLAFIDDLNALLGIADASDEFLKNTKENLAMTGFIRFQGGGEMNGGDKISYFLSPLGQLFIDIMTDKLDKVLTL